MKKRFVTLLLVLTMALSLLPGTAWAVIERGNVPYCQLYYAYNTDTKALTLTGTGTLRGSGGLTPFSWTTVPYHDVETVVIESGATGIGALAFDFFSSLTSITIPDTVTFIGSFAFSKCYSLPSITIPSGVTEIGQDAFDQCRSLERVTILGPIKTIDKVAFAACQNLRTVTFPSRVSSHARIEQQAFAQCYSLESIVIPEGVESIEMDAFNKCTSLRSVTFPTTLLYLTYDAFSGCSALESITFTGDAPSISGNGSAFYDSTATVYYPAGNDTWTADVMQRCGGNLTWKAYCDGDHTLGEWTNVDETTHKRTCAYCDYEETADHGWDEGTVTLAPTCQATGEALFTCAVCAATRTETLPIADHPYNEWTKVDENTHTHACTVCGTEETVAHTWDEGSVITAANCIAGGETVYTCTGCGLTRNEAVAMTGIHTYDHGCDKDCNVCGATRTTEHRYADDWTSGKAGHWHTCVNCGAKGTVADHVPGPEATEETAQLCTVCDYILHPTLQHEHDYAAALTGDDTGHWYACASCSEQKDFAAHAFDNDCDTKCDACGYQRVTEHRWSEAWSYDEAGHFHTCTVCGAKKDDAAHDFRRGTCTVCAAEDPDYEPPTVPIIIAIAVCAVAAAAVFVLRGKKKKSAA